MLKVLLDTTLAVKVMDKEGYNTYVPKSQVRLSEDGEYVIAAKQWIIDSKNLNQDLVSVDETIGLKLERIDDETGKVYNLSKDNSKCYKRKLYLNKRRNMLIFNFKTNVYAIPNNSEGLYTNENGLIYLGNYEDGYSFDNQIEEYFERVKEVKEVVKEIETKVKEEVFDFNKTVKHVEFETIKSCVKNDIPVYLYGPAGSGKNFTLQQIAEELELEFYFTNSVQQEFKITGFIDAGGTYHETEFYKAFTQGGLFFLDEMDASIPEVLVLLNAAIANGYFEFPNGKEYADPDFRVVAAGNTIGSGADEQYTGRLILDQATLDRFVSIEFNYDRNIELHLAKGNVELVDFIRGLRDKSQETGIRMTFSYRAITNVTKLEETGMELGKILMIAVFKGLDKDTVSTLREKYSTNKYYRAMVAA